MWRPWVRWAQTQGLTWGRGEPETSTSPSPATCPLHCRHPAPHLCVPAPPPPAPELLEGQGAVPQTDIWAIGVTTFIM